MSLPILVEAVEPLVIEQRKSLPWQAYYLACTLVLAVVCFGLLVMDGLGYLEVKGQAHDGNSGARTYFMVTTPPRGCVGFLGIEPAGGIEDCVVSRLADDIARDLRQSGFAEATSRRVPYSEKLAAYYVTGLTASELSSACAFVTGKWGYYKCDVQCR